MQRWAFRTHSTVGIPHATHVFSWEHPTSKHTSSLNGHCESACTLQFQRKKNKTFVSMTACCKLWLNRWRDAVPFEYQPRHVPCPYVGHTFYLVNSFLPKEVTTPPTSHHDLTELLHDASLVLENLHGTASCHLNGNPPFTMRGGGSGCAGVRCSIIASIFAHTLFRPSLLFIPPFVPMRMLLLLVPLRVPLLPLF